VLEPWAPFSRCALLSRGPERGLGPNPAGRGARRMTAHARWWRRWFAGRPFSRSVVRTSWRDLLLALAYAAVAACTYLGVARIGRASAFMAWWWPYELLGTLYLLLYLAFLEGTLGTAATFRQRLVLMAALYGGLAGALHLVFRLPLGPLLAAALLLVPGYLPVLSWGGEGMRTRFLYRGGRSFCILVLSFFFLVSVASMLEGAGVRHAGRGPFEGAVMILWGAVFYLLRGTVEAVDAHARTRLGSDDRES
jgi:hypothetical protein